MKYYFKKVIKTKIFQDAIDEVTRALKNQGFGVLTAIDMQATLRKKLDVDFRRYTILGACNPLFAYEALKQEEEIGLLLPCNVVVQEISNGFISVAFVDPVIAMGFIENPELEKFAKQVKNQLTEVLKNLN